MNDLCVIRLVAFTRLNGLEIVNIFTGGNSSLSTSGWLITYNVVVVQMVSVSPLEKRKLPQEILI